MNLRNKWLAGFAIGATLASGSATAAINANELHIALTSLKLALVNGVIVQPGTTAPFMLLNLYSSEGTYDNIFLANYAIINLQYALTRVSGVSQVQIFGAGPYAMRVWVNPDKLANLGVTISDITNAVKA